MRYPESFTALAGRGLQATVEGHTILAGTRGLLTEHAVSFVNVEKQLKTFELMSLNTESVHDPQKSSNIHAIYYYRSKRPGSDSPVRQPILDRIISLPV